MKKGVLKLASLVAISFASFASEAVIFTCDGFVSNVRATSNGDFRVSLTRNDGLFLDGAVIPAERSFLLGQLLIAAQSGDEYTLVLEHTETSDTRCRDNNEGAGDLIGLTRRN